MKTDLYGSGLTPLENNSTKVHQNKLNVVPYEKVQDSDSGSANLRKTNSAPHTAMLLRRLSLSADLYIGQWWESLIPIFHNLRTAKIVVHREHPKDRVKVKAVL